MLRTRRCFLSAMITTKAEGFVRRGSSHRVSLKDDGHVGGWMFEIEPTSNSRPRAITSSSSPTTIMPPKATPTSSGLPTRSSSRLKTSTAPKAPAQPTQPPPTRTRSTRALAASTSGSTPAAGLTSSTKAALKDTKPTAAPIKRVLTARETKPAASNVWVETPSVKSAKDAPNKGKAYDSDREPIKVRCREQNPGKRVAFTLHWS